MEITKPEVTSKYIRIPVASPQKSDQIRTITISAKEGISALYAYNRKTILTYLFSRAKGWNMAKAQAWIKSHKTGKSLNNLIDKAMEQTNRFKFVLPIIKTRVEIVRDEAGNQIEEHYIIGKASSTDKDLVGDRMDPSAIKTMAESLKQHVINLNAEHDTSWLFEMGDVTTLSVTDNSDLLFESKLNKMSASKDLWYAITELHKKLGVSVGGYVKAYEWEEEENTGEMLRVFKDIELDHIAIVSQPANPKTWVEAIQKSLNETKPNELLTNAGKEDSDETKTNLIFNEKHMTKKENSLEAEKKVSAAPEDEKKTEKSKEESEEVKSEKKESIKKDDKKSDETTKGTKEDEKPVDEKEEKVEKKKEGKEEVDVEEKVEVKSKTPDKKETVEKKEEKVEEKKEEKKIEEVKADELIEKAVGKLTESLEKKFASITEGIESLTKRVESIEDMPAERKGVDVSKGVGNENDGKSANGEDAKTLMEKELKAAETQFVNNADKQFTEKARIRRFYKDNYGIE